MTVLYLANPSSGAILDAMEAGEIGMIDTPFQGGIRVREAHERGVTWCADNGAFTDRWDADTWWAWLNAPGQFDHRDTCLFATAPDVVGDAWATQLRAMPWLPMMRELDYPVAYVLQDGARADRIPWHLTDAVFIGGTTVFKLGKTARALVHEAKGRGKWVHMGRVNSSRRLGYAKAIGCDSADGTFLKYGPDTNLPRMRRWLRDIAHPDLFSPA